MGTNSRSAQASSAEREAKLDALHETLTDAVQALVSGEDWQRAMKFAAKFRRYSFGNCLLLAAQSHAAHEKGLLPEPYPRYVAGYRQWQQLGRQVIKGSRSFQILAPTTARVAVADNGSVRRLSKGERPETGEAVTTKMVGVRPAHVFPAEFTEGPEPLPQAPTPQLLRGEAPAGLWDGLATLIRQRDFTLDDVPTAAQIGGANGVTMWGPDQILVRADMDPLARVKTLAHETGHLVGHTPGDPDVPAHRGIAEVEAESVAAFVLAAHGVDSADYTVPYVSTWASRVKDVDPVTTVQQTAARVRTIALTILDGLDTSMVSDGDPPGLDRSVRNGTPDRTPAPRAAAAASAKRQPSAAEPSLRPPASAPAPPASSIEGPGR